MSSVIAESNTFQQLRDSLLADGFLIPEEKLRFGKMLGRGASGTTYAGTYQGQKVAIKAYSANILREEGEVVRNEEALMSRLKHENIVKFVGMCMSLDPLAVALVTEFAERGELGLALYREKIFQSDQEPWQLKIKIATGVAKGLQYLHENNVIHRDVKPANVLLGKEYQALLTDFGFSRFVDTSGNMTGETGSYKYMAPEVIQHTRYTSKADTYSYGILINELFSEQQPFINLLPVRAAMEVVKNNARPNQDNIKNPILKELIQKCWRSDPAQRPDWDEILNTLEYLAPLKN